MVMVVEFQFFPVLDVSITGFENGELRKCAFCTHPFLWNLRRDEVWICDSGAKDMIPTETFLHSSCFRLVLMSLLYTVHIGVNFRGRLSSVGPGFSLIPLQEVLIQELKRLP